MLHPSTGCQGAGPLLEKREKGRTPSCFASMFKDNPALYFLAKVGHPPIVSNHSLAAVLREVVGPAQVESS